MAYPKVMPVTAHVLNTQVAGELDLSHLLVSYLQLDTCGVNINLK